MKRFLAAAALAALTLPALAADVGVSVSVGQPGFYGHIDIGDFPPPQVIYRQPVRVERAPSGFVQEPIYLHVPPGHARHWRKHCYRYNACGQPVYFVQDNWYNEVYVPRYRERYRGEGYRDERDERRGWDRDHDRDHDHDRGHVREHGHGRGHRGD